MTENKCKSLENLLSNTRGKLLPKQSPEHFENYRNELHREMAKHWPIQMHRSNSINTQLITSKRTTHSSVRDGTYSTRLSEKKKKIQTPLISMNNEISFNEHQENNEWHLKTQEGVISYQLPDGLPDSAALYDKLQQLMKTDTIYLNDRHFWTKLENQFKKLRKQNLQQNIERLRQNQQQYEQELISKGIIPYTTDEAIKIYAKQSQTQTKIESIIPNNTNHKNCVFADLSSHDMKINELDAFESDNVHPCFDEICSNYQFQTKSGRELEEKFSKDLHQAQMQIKTIFPKTTRRDSIRQELAAIRTSEGLYAYSNRLPRRTSK